MITFKYGLSLIILALAVVNAKKSELSHKQILKKFIDQLNSTSGSSNADVNKFVEQLILVPLRIYISTNNEPTPLEDDEFQWKYQFPNSRVNGTMVLKEGQLHGVYSIVIEGQSSLRPDKENWILTVPVTFNHLKYNYRYSTKYKGMSLKGPVRGELTDPLYTLFFKIERESYRLTLGFLHMDRNCKRSVRVEGNHTPKMHKMLTAVLEKHLTETRFTEAVGDKIVTFVETVFG